MLTPTTSSSRLPATEVLRLALASARREFVARVKELSSDAVPWNDRGTGLVDVGREEAISDLELDAFFPGITIAAFVEAHKDKAPNKSAALPHPNL